MQTELRFICDLPSGFHARPASIICEVVRRFRSRVWLAKGDGTPIDARSVLSIVGLDVHAGDACIVRAEGDDADSVIEAFRRLVESELAAREETQAPAADPSAKHIGRLPPGLRALNTAHILGRPVCAGVGAGECVLVGGLELPSVLRGQNARSVELELADIHAGIAAVREELTKRAASSKQRMEGDLLRAHSEIAGDPALITEIERLVHSGRTAAQAVVDAAGLMCAVLRQAESAYVRDRAVDVQDVCMQVLGHVTGGMSNAVEVTLERDSVIFAEELTANQLLRMDRSRVRGLVLGGVGATSHTVILARSLRIPTVIDVPHATSIAAHGSRAIVDGTGGFVITEVGQDVERYYQRESVTQDRWLKRVVPLAQQPAVTHDGVRLEIGVNASIAEEVAGATAMGADGVGLLRTELLFLDRAVAPSEDEQYDAYSAVVQAAAGRSVIIRTFDIGGDKPAAYLSMPHEENPFLGVRGIRLYELHPELLRGQLRAIARASALGTVKVMAPMVATAVEAAWFRGKVREVQGELKAAGVAFDGAMPIGVMIEVPSVALVMDHLSDVVDFFSIGTNDLCQYWMAVDRGNPGVGALYNPRQPSFLRLLRQIVTSAKERGKWIGVCGEMAGESSNIPIMLGLGVDEISVAPGELRRLKLAVGERSAALCRDLLDKAMACRDTESVERLLGEQTHLAGNVAPVIDAGLVEIGSDAMSKSEAVKEAVDALFIAGRTDRPRDVEEAVWAREATYSTGLGHGFAVPHCKSDAVRVPSLVVLKLHTPIEWGSMDGQPVRVVMLLTIPLSDTSGAHMKVFAKLARRLMHEEFRDRLEQACDPAAVERLLNDELGLAG